MNVLPSAFFLCLVATASALPSGIWGGHLAHVVPAGPTTLIGASGVVGPNGAAGPAGVVNGHGSVGPNGEANAIAWDGDDGQWHGEGLLASQDLAGHGAAAVGLIGPTIIGGHGLGIAGAHW